MSGELAEDGLPPLREVLSRHELNAKKSLGQNFLLDLNLTRRIARAAGPLEQVVEVGPGPGGLTRALLMEGAQRVIAIERDSRCIAALEEVAARWPGRLVIVEGDALEIDPTTYLDGGRGVVAANLPYNVGTELLVRWLRGAGDGEQWPSWWDKLTLMFQREVAERIVAKPGSKAYGRLSVLAAWRAEARILFDISPRAFTPPPKITSSVVSLTPRSAPDGDCRLRRLERVTTAAFTQRRKMLRGSLKSLGHDPATLLDAADVSGELRADATTLAQYVALAAALERLETRNAPPAD